ncbi:unnamed protein product [Zymoseptoria tritici ST99CH_3D7]|uniref:Uncharacterized protein n=1 Tax=Zymoseptoria tritici (strain ST99CH_3D7) TaxID=1276538 RepID=A0A1X7RZ18_ZYMT9|nr:unnamed protein product [Zymoseptoria tritici ST99CH_3D7]
MKPTQIFLLFAAAGLAVALPRPIEAGVVSREAHVNSNAAGLSLRSISRAIVNVLARRDHPDVDDEDFIC